MNFGQAKQRVLDSIGAVTGELDNEIERWLLDAIDDIWAANPKAPWLEKSGTFSVRGPLTGTATWTKGTTSVVLDTGGAASAALAAEYVDGLIKLSTYPYVITAYTQATQTLTVASEIIEASGVAAAYTVIQDQNTMPSYVDTVTVINDMSLLRRPIFLINPNKRRRLWPDPFDAIGSDPYYAWSRGVDAAGNVEIGLYPPPGTDRTYFFEYYKRSVHPVVDGDDLQALTGIPAEFHPVIVAGAKKYAFEFEREHGETSARVALQWFEGIRTIKKHGGGAGGSIHQASTGREGRGSSFDNPTITAPTGLPFEG